MRCMNCKRELVTSVGDKTDNVNNTLIVRYVLCKECNQINIVDYIYAYVRSSYPEKEGIGYGR